MLWEHKRRKHLTLPGMGGKGEKSFPEKAMLTIKLHLRKSVRVFPKDQMESGISGRRYSSAKRGAKQKQTEETAAGWVRLKPGRQETELQQRWLGVPVQSSSLALVCSRKAWAIWAALQCSLHPLLQVMGRKQHDDPA